MNRSFRFIIFCSLIFVTVISSLDVKQEGKEHDRKKRQTAEAVHKCLHEESHLSNIETIREAITNAASYEDLFNVIHDLSFSELECLTLLMSHQTSAKGTVKLIPLSPSGLRWEIPDDGYSLVAVHFSVNVPLAGAELGQHNVFPQKEGLKWVSEIQDVKLEPGDEVNYWLYKIKDNRPQVDSVKTWTYKMQHASKSPILKDPSKCHMYPCLIFEDNFETLDMKIWEHEITAGGGGNWEFQYYTNSRINSYVRDGVLYLKPTLTADTFGAEFLESGRLDLWGGGPYEKCTGNQFYGCERTGSPNNILNPIQSARLRSSRGFNFRYGKVEVEAKLPKGDWIWPAIWMLPTYNSYGGWPMSGEIDIMESRGNLDYVDPHNKSQGVDSIGSTLHFGPTVDLNRWYLAHTERRKQQGTFGDDFHKYGLEWTENHLKFFLDGEEILTIDPGKEGFWKFGGFNSTGAYNPWSGASKMAPFDQEFHLILNVAVGGFNFFPDNFINAAYTKPWQNADQTSFWKAKHQWYPTWNPNENNGEGAAMKINYVKVWKLSNN